MKSERIAAENNSIVPPEIKLEFVLSELHRLRTADPMKARLLYWHISRAKNAIVREMKRCTEVRIDIEHSRSPKAEAIIEKLFVRFVCQSPS